jgi:PKD domain-containing protein
MRATVYWAVSTVTGQMSGKTLKAMLTGCALPLLCAAHAAAAPAWLPPADFSAPLRNARNQQVAMDAAGDTVALWERESTTGPGNLAQVVTRAPGGGFGAPETLSPVGTTMPVLAMTPGGSAVAAWWSFANPPGAYVLRLATRPPGGSFSAPVEIKELPASVIPRDLELAVNASGDVALAWTSRDPESSVDPNANFVEASVRAAGGGFSEPVVVSPQPVVVGESAALAGVAIDAAGEATVVWENEGSEHVVVEAASRPPGGPFSAGQEVNGPLAAGEDAVSADVASDDAGDLTVVWVRANASTDVVEAADLAGGTVSAPAALSGAGEKSFLPEIATSPGGVSTVIWQHLEAGNVVVQASRRASPGAAFTPHEDVSAAEAALFGPRLATNGSGAAVVAWSGSVGVGQVVRASIAKPGAGFGAPIEISASSPDPMRPAVSIDDAGDATVLWSRSNGANNIVQFAGYDALAPELRGVSIPSSGTVGVPVAFSAGTFDVWPIGPPSFDFGDGQGATGSVVSHNYAAPGSYRVAVSAVDAAGTPVRAEGTISILARNDFSIGRLKLNRRKGTGRLTVAVPGPGKLVLSGRGVRKVERRAVGAGSVVLPVGTRGSARKRLRRRGELKLKLRVAFAPEGGSTAVRTKRAKLFEKRG